jgi:hypothetical protein
MRFEKNEININNNNYFLKDLTEKYANDLFQAMENCLLEFIEYIMNETGLSKKCSIEYIKKLCNLKFDVKIIDDKSFVVLEPSFKSPEELLSENNYMSDECTKELL